MDYTHGVVVDDDDGIYDEDILHTLTDSLDYCFRWTEKERITQDIPVKV
jgi:hypothetical protein